MKPSKGILIGFWIFTALFCLEMSFTAYWELVKLPDAALAFARLGFPSNAFRLELSWAKVLGVLVLLLPLRTRAILALKEWAYAGFALNLVSALIAHASIHDRHLAFLPSTLTSLLWLGSYSFFRRLTTAPANASSPLNFNQRTGVKEA
jgi:hypothetical protein